MAEIEARDGLFKAVPLDISDTVKLTYMLDRLVEHESEWTDFQADPKVRRTIASSYFADAVTGKIVVLEVWRLDHETTLIGLIGFTDINPGVDLSFHPVFFDGKLKNGVGKRELLLRAMDWAFDTFNLNRMSLQVPEDRYALVKFSRTKLGFRFEAENRTIRQERVTSHGRHYVRKLQALTPSWQQAELGSRRYQAVKRGGAWLDMLCLSITRDEFGAFVREASCQASSIDPIPSRPSPATSKD